MVRNLGCHLAHASVSPPLPYLPECRENLIPLTLRPTKLLPPALISPLLSVLSHSPWSFSQVPSALGQRRQCGSHAWLGSAAPGPVSLKRPHDGVEKEARHMGLRHTDPLGPQGPPGRMHSSELTEGLGSEPAAERSPSSLHGLCPENSHGEMKITWRVLKGRRVSRRGPISEGPFSARREQTPLSLNCTRPARLRTELRENGNALSRGFHTTQRIQTKDGTDRGWGQKDRQPGSGLGV